MNKKVTFNEVLQSFLFARKAERYSQNTIRSYESALRKFSLFVNGANKSIKEITADDVRFFLGSQTNLADKTILNYHIALSSLFTWAIENDLASDHVIKKVKKPKYVKNRVIPFTEDEIIRLVKLNTSVRDRAIVLVLLDCGVRASELCNLTVNDWQDGALNIRRGKGKKNRVVPISDLTEKYLYKQLCKRRINVKGVTGGSALFASNISGNSLNYNSLRSIMDRLQLRTSILNVHPHRFRHTFAINFLRNGGNIYSLKEILGHSTLEMVQNYLYIAQSDIKQAHEKASPVKNFFSRN